jgi:hypothetical protein
MPTTGKGFPYPSSSDNPDIPGDFQALAEAIDTELDSYSLSGSNTTYHFEGSQHDTDDVDLELMGSDGSKDTVHFRAGPGGLVEWDETEQRITFAAGGDLKAIVELTGTSGLLRKTDTETWELDTTTYSDSTHSHTLDGLSDVIISSATNGQVLKFNGTNWVNGDDATGEAGAAGNAFTTIVPSSGNNVAADSATDTLTLTAGTGVSITGDDSSDTITFSLDSDLAGIASATLTSAGFIKTNGSGEFSVDTASYITGSSPTIATPTLTLSTSTSVDEGRIAWDATNDKIIIGDGSTGREFASSTLKTNARTSSYTLVLTDKDKLVEISNASANTLTVPLNSSVPYPIGTQINLLQTGAGQTTIAGASGVTVNATPGLKLRAQWSSATLIKRATDTWVLVGDLSA